MNTIQSFEHIRTRSIGSLSLDVEEYRHRATGAQHIHISADNTENVFLVALRTVPEDSRGVAHILEHTALCGSEKYPVRDPFFMMIRRSLNTFMNAFTSSDWTAYPFASQNSRDFSNLLDVYLDAVFFPRLDPLDFAQEGHRLEFSEIENPDSPLEFKGVVFNEMKGAMSSATSLLWHNLCEHLYPSTTYHYNSGGDPRVIPDLSFQELLDFHRTHYHPSNAIFMTFGNMSASGHQQVFQDRVLSRFGMLDHEIAVPLEQRYRAPKSAVEHYAIPEDEDGIDKTHVVMGWLLGESTDLKQAMHAHLLTSILLENSASPLQQALETTDLGRAPSPLCGLDDSQREMCFVCGLEGCPEGAAEAVEQLIMDTLGRVAAQGVPLEHMEACLHQLELQQREISGDTYPFGLQLILSALNSATHRGDPLALLDLEPVIAELRHEIREPGFVQRLCQNLLVDNPHRVRLTLQPDPELGRHMQADERRRLDQIRTQLSTDEAQQVIDQALALKARQALQDDPDLLPKVGLEDVATEIQYPQAHIRLDDPHAIISYAAGTNGLVYQEVVCELPSLKPGDIELLPLLTYVWTELGLADKSYLDVQQWQTAVSGGIHCSMRIQPQPDNQFDAGGRIILSGKALKANQAALSELLHSTLDDLRLDEGSRVRELVSQARAQSENQVTGNGHMLAMVAASQNCAPAAALTHRTSGLLGIRNLKELDDSLVQDAQLDHVLGRLEQLHRRVAAMPREFLVIGERQELPDYQAGIIEAMSAAHQHPRETAPEAITLPEVPPDPVRELWIANAQVSYCAKAFATVPTAHPDAAPLTVLGGFMRNGFLHTAIRERGGAYGGGATQDSLNGAFRLFSYRDPRLQETLEDFDRAIQWVLEEKQDARMLEEAILGVIASLDKPGSPAGEARQAYHGDLFGRTATVKKAFRDAVLTVQMNDLKRVAETYLQPDRAHVAVLTGSQRETDAGELDMELIRL